MNRCARTNSGPQPPTPASKTPAAQPPKQNPMVDSRPKPVSVARIRERRIVSPVRRSPNIVGVIGRDVDHLRIGWLNVDRRLPALVLGGHRLLAGWTAAFPLAWARARMRCTALITSACAPGKALPRSVVQRTSWVSFASTSRQGHHSLYAGIQFCCRAASVNCWPRRLPLACSHCCASTSSTGYVQATRTCPSSGSG